MIEVDRSRDPLLKDVSKLVGNQLSPALGLWSIPPEIESYVVAYRVSQGSNGLCGEACLGVRMNPNLAEIPAESRLHEAARLRAQRLPW